MSDETPITQSELTRRVDRALERYDRGVPLIGILEALKEPTCLCNHEGIQRDDGWKYINPKCPIHGDEKSVEVNCPPIHEKPQCTCIQSVGSRIIDPQCPIHGPKSVTIDCPPVHEHNRGAKPRDPMQEIEVGDPASCKMGYHGYATQPVLCLDEHFVWTPLGRHSRLDVTLYKKRLDRPGDGFVHLDHTEWGIGVCTLYHNRTGVYYFPTQTCHEDDRSRMVRVFCTTEVK